MRLSADMFGSCFIGEWEDDEFSFLFFTADASDAIQAVLADRPLITLLDQYLMTYSQWLGETLRPIRVGPFHIIPLGTETLPLTGTAQRETPSLKKKEGRHTILLDPGVVFGTGTHETTHDCLEAIALAGYAQGIETVLDLGTGAGVLALAAASMGSSSVIAVDFNFLATLTAARNVVLNQLQDKVMVVRGRAQDFIEYPADLIIANIHYDVMKHLIRSYGFYRSEMFILSGLMRTEAKTVESYLAQQPVKIIKKWNNNGIWHTYLGSINQSSISETGRLIVEKCV